MPDIRAEVVRPLRWMSVRLDEGRNAEARADVDVAHDESRVRVLVIHTREDLMVARETRRIADGCEQA